MAFDQSKQNEKLMKTASILSGENGKGILPADESITTYTIMFRAIYVENNEEKRRQYRQILFSATGLPRYISGVLLSPEAFSQKTNQGYPFPVFLRSRGLLPGVSVDLGLSKIKSLTDEWLTQGLDHLANRCTAYKQEGCSFTNWRSVFKVTREHPSPLAIQENAYILARYASIAQANMLVPMVEIGLLNERSSHHLERTQKVLETILAAVFKALQDAGVLLEGLILRLSMVLPGDDCKMRYPPEVVAAATLAVLQRTVPPAVAGIAFLSGDLTTDEVTVALDTMNAAIGRKPWPLTFSFSRPLHAGVLITWLGRDDWVPYCQDILVKLAEANFTAANGKYVSEMQKKIELCQ